jgi:hypothetical protein
VHFSLRDGHEPLGVRAESYGLHMRCPSQDYLLNTWLLAGGPIWEVLKRLTGGA